MVQQLVSFGYVRNETVRGAPYDWRIAPSKLNASDGQQTSFHHSTKQIVDGSLYVRTIQL